MKRMVRIVTSAMGIWIMEVFLLFLVSPDSINRYTVILTSFLAALLAWRLYKAKEET